MELAYHTKRNPLSGALVVYYKCPHCHAELHSPIADAGSPENCPECRAAFTVPGVEEKQSEAERVQRTATDRRAAEVERQQRLNQAERQAAAIAQRKIAGASLVPRTHGLWIVGHAIELIGIVVVLAAIAMDTATTVSSGSGLERVHNLGLLAGKLLTGMIGCTMMLGGAVYYAIAMLGNEVNRWGRDFIRREGDSRAAGGTTQ